MKYTASYDQNHLKIPIPKHQILAIDCQLTVWKNIASCIPNIFVSFFCVCQRLLSDTSMGTHTLVQTTEWLLIRGGGGFFARSSGGAWAVQESVHAIEQFRCEPFKEIYDGVADALT